MKFLVIGAGSIGERHIRNLLTLGYEDILVFRSRNLPLRTVNPQRINIITDWQAALAHRPDAALICSPTALHLEQTLQCVRAGMHVFAEKPLSHTSEGLEKSEEELRERKVLLQVGYMMRFHPLLRRVKQFIKTATYGKLVSFHSHWGEYLPDWHPWEDYRTSYAARRDLGGGAGLTLSHDIDAALWLAGREVTEHCMLPNFGGLPGTDTDNATDILLRFAGGTTGHIHLNFFQKNPERRYEYRFEEATVTVDYFANSLNILQKNKPPQTKTLADFDRNDMFLAQAQAFIENVKTTEEERVAFGLKELETSKIILKILGK